MSLKYCRTLAGARSRVDLLRRALPATRCMRGPGTGFGPQFFHPYLLSPPSQLKLKSLTKTKPNCPCFGFLSESQVTGWLFYFRSGSPINRPSRLGQDTVNWHTVWCSEKAGGQETHSDPLSNTYDQGNWKCSTYIFIWKRKTQGSH